MSGYFERILDPGADPDALVCLECGSDLALATGVCVGCGADPMGYYDDMPEFAAAVRKAART